MTQRGKSDIEVVSLTSETHTTLMLVRGQDGVVDAGELGLDHLRLNVLMRKGLVENVGLGKWEATDRGRRVAVSVKR